MACAPLDRVAREFDEKYGVDRLVSLVSPAMADRYGKAIAALHAAYDASDPTATAAHAANCIKGLYAMDAEATAAGHKPADPRVWIVQIDGHAYGFVDDVAFIDIATKANPGVRIATLRQAVVAINPDRFGMTAAIIAAFPGSTVTDVRPRSQLEESLDDEIPF